MYHAIPVRKAKSESGSLFLRARVASSMPRVQLAANYALLTKTAFISFAWSWEVREPEF